jgi:hypothetical protein
VLAEIGLCFFRVPFKTITHGSILAVSMKILHQHNY